MLEVIIASTRRPQTLHDTLCSLAEQKRRPDRVILSLVRPEDFDGCWPDGLTGIAITEAAGASAQRNAGVRHLLPGTDVVLFLDDDVTLAPDCLANGEQVFREKLELMVVSENFLRDGGVTHLEGRELLARAPRPAWMFTPAANCYGCLFFVRRTLLEKEQFDERLVGYSYLEDVDFARRALRHGEVGYHSGLSFVHLRAGSGRVNDRQFGYVQVVNPFYLYRKGSINLRELLQKCWLTSLASNGVYAVLGGFFGRRPGDYQRRLAGNLYGLWEMLLGKAAPERCLRF
jgi:glycosyltransferase involved in cell wall biosynthesis